MDERSIPDPDGRAAGDPTPPGAAAWRPVSRHLSTVRLLGTLWFFVILLAGSGVAVWGALATGFWWLWIAVAAGPLLVGWLCWLVPRQVRAIGWVQREDDLLIRHGILFRQTVAVPYGRMQYLDVSSGPLRRRWNLATLELHTAAEATDASLPGLLREEADELRDVFAQRGQAKLAGL